MRVVALILSAVLAGCATAPGQIVPTRWVQLDDDELRRVCAARNNRAQLVTRFGFTRTGDIGTYGHINGCYDWISGVCVIYTRKGDASERALQCTAGHEYAHCHLGNFHN